MIVLIHQILYHTGKQLKKIKLVVAVVLACCIILSSCAKSEFKVSDILGEYTIAEKLYSVNTMVVVNPFNYTDTLVKIEERRVEIVGVPISIDSPYYDVIKITEDMLNNGLYSQGAALQSGIMSTSARENIKGDCYAIFPEKPFIEDMYPKSDRVVIYCVDGEVYLYYGFVVYRLEKTS